MKSIMHIPMPIQNKINPIKRFIKDTRIDVFATILCRKWEKFRSMWICFFL